MWPGGRPFRRAAKWDGVAPIGYDGTGYPVIEPDQLRDILDLIGKHRQANGPYDATIANMWLGDRAKARDQIAELEEAGATWAREYWDPDSGMPWEDWLTEMMAGPPR